MKQNITQEQLDELTTRQRKKLEDWVFENITKTVNKFIPLLSIGQMIEFLEDNKEGGWEIYNLPVQISNDKILGLFVVNNYGKYYRRPELCDAIWEAVKEVLKEK